MGQWSQNRRFLMRAKRRARSKSSNSAAPQWISNSDQAPDAPVGPFTRSCVSDEAAETILEPKLQPPVRASVGSAPGIRLCWVQSSPDARPASCREVYERLTEKLIQLISMFHLSIGHPRARDPIAAWKIFGFCLDGGWNSFDRLQQSKR